MRKCNCHFSFRNDLAKLLSMLLPLTYTLLLAVAVSGKAASHTNGWVSSKRAASQEMVKVTFNVKQSNLDLVAAELRHVSEPNSPGYGRYLTFDQVGKLTRSPASTAAVLSWLQEIGVGDEDIETTTFGHFVTARLSVAVAEKQLGASFHEYIHEDFYHSVIKTVDYTIPKALEEHITHISHMSNFPFKKQPRMTTHLGDAPAQTVPETIFSTYGIESNDASHSGASSQSLFESLNQDFDPLDLEIFQERFNLSSSPVTEFIGPNDPSACRRDPNSCGEANLDVEYMIAVASGARTVYWSIKIDRYNPDPFTTWAAQMSDTKNPPLVHSISYGAPEGPNLKEDMDLFNIELQKLALRGVTVVVSSGDDGAVSRQVRQSPYFCGYAPSFPASSPYVVSVGATMGPESGDPEVSCSSDTGGVITTGGGFSMYFDQPEYQHKAIAKFFKHLESQPEEGYVSTGRGFPDVSALGHNYLVIDGGRVMLESGTSASAPVFAGMLTLINDARLAEGKSPVGFVNPALYGFEDDVWNDIVEGNNRCAAGQGNPNCCSEGFQAGIGWDPVTGLGTPRFKALKKAFMKL